MLQEVIDHACDIDHQIEALRGLSRPCRDYSADDQFLAELAEDISKSLPRRIPKDVYLDIHQEYLKTIRIIIQRNHWSTTEHLLKGATGNAKIGRLPAEYKHLSQVNVIYKELMTGHREYEKFVEQLKSDPQDEQAQRKVGEFLAFHAGDWNSAIKYLAKSKTSNCFELVINDLTVSETPNEMLKLASSWEEYALSDRDQEPYLARAVDWYQKVAENSEGLVQTEAQNKIQQLKHSHFESTSSTKDRLIEFLDIVPIESGTIAMGKSTDPPNHFHGPEHLKFIDIEEAKITLKNDRYYCEVVMAEPLPNPNSFQGTQAINVMWAIDADSNLKTGQTPQWGNEFNVHVVVKRNAINPSWHVVGNIASPAQQHISLFETSYEGKTILLSFPKKCLPSQKFAFTVNVRLQGTWPMPARNEAIPRGLVLPVN